MAALRKGVKLVLAGLFNIEVNVLAAADDDDKETAFKTICVGEDDQHTHPPTAVKQSLGCPTCDNNVRDTFVKGREVSKGSFVVVDPSELAAADVEAELKEQMQLTVHDAADVTTKTLPGAKTYFLEPGKGPLTHKAYNLLRDKIKENPDKAYCTVWAARSKPGMYRLGVFGTAITLEQLCWPENVRSAPDVPAEEYSEAESAMLDQLVEAISADFDPSTYRDVRKEQIAAVIAAAEAVDGIPTAASPKKTAAPALDLSGALAAALAATGKAPAKKTAAKKTAAKAKKPAA